jgi:hypothetical protein
LESPVTLPPGRASEATRPPPTGSIAIGKTTGMLDVACLTAATALPGATMTSTLRRANSAACSAKRSRRPSPQRYSMATVRPLAQPSSPSLCSKAAIQAGQPDAVAVAVPRNPMVGSFGCARAARGHVSAAVAPPSIVSNSRRRTKRPRGNDRSRYCADFAPV